jgi:glucosamine 6-phosphate synthetase-like amidotransferase/phosphosugar isomerase protein
LNNSLKQLKSDATEELKPYTGTAQEWWDKNKTIIDNKEYLFIEDYNNRKWKMNKKDFDIHTIKKKKKREYRTNFLDTIFDVAKNPDEVWLNRDINNKASNIQELNNRIMIKYYKDYAIAVTGRIVNNDLVFKTWFDVRDKNVRSGILIKK